MSNTSRTKFRRLVREWVISRRGVATIGGMALIVGFLVALPRAFAGIGLGVAPDFPASVTVGQTGVSVGMNIQNTSTADAGTITLGNIFLTPQCGQTGIPCAQPDPGVFAVSATGTGSMSCTGTNFTITEVDASTGKVQFTPNNPVAIPLGDTCRINFTVDVLKTPTHDVTGLVSGIQTAQLGEVTATDSNQLPGSGTGTDVTTVNPAASTTVTQVRSVSNTDLTGTSVPVGTVIHDHATVTGDGPAITGTVNFLRFSTIDCSGPSTAENGVALTAGQADSSPFTTVAGAVSYLAHYNGDANHNPSDGICEPLTVTKLDSTTVTHIRDAGNADITGTTVPVGTMIHDNATVSGSGPVPTGTVDFKLFATIDCSSTFTTQSGVALSGGSADSTPWTPPVGSLSYLAHYNGDATYNPSDGTCEPLTVHPLDSVTVTQIHDPSEKDVTGASVPVGTVIHDQVTVSGSGPIPTGTVNFLRFATIDCSGPSSAENGVALSGGVAMSSPFTTVAGAVSFMAHYNGDAIYNPSDGSCEPLAVNKLPSLTVTHVHDASHNDITGTSVPVGSMIHDNAMVSGSGPVPTGTVDFALYMNGTCSGDPSSTQTGVALSGGMAESTPWAPAVGSIGYIASYSGDANYLPSTGTCEPLTIVKINSTTVTHVHNASHNDITGTTVPVGTMIHDNAMVSGSGPVPTGTVDFALYMNGTCSGDPSSTQTGVALSGGVAESTPWTPPAGSLGYVAHYNGDGIYNPSTGGCEPLTVAKLPSVTVTQVRNVSNTDITSTSVPVGTVVHDHVTVSGTGPVPTGTVDFALFSNGTCANTPTSVEAGVALSGGSADSTPWTPPVGSISYLAHYNGDATYNPSDGVCEPLTIVKINSATVTHIQDASNNDITGTTVDGGTVIHDQAVVSGSGPTPTGTVDFHRFATIDCTGTPVDQLGVALTAGVATSAPFTTVAGTPVSYMVHYNGDGTYNPSDGTCEPLTVRSPAVITRTLGFWQTHTNFTTSIFMNQLAGSITVGTGGHIKMITNAGQLFGGFYASIPWTTTGGKRNALDQARIQLLQQLLAADLNCAAFGCSASTMTLISNANAAYASGPASLILSLTSQLDAYNNSGDTMTIPSSLGPIGSATPKQSQAIANLAYWDTP